MERREKVRQFIRSELLEAGIRIFGVKGFHQATLEEIAKEAEVAVGTLYLYFKNKEEMYFALLEQKCTEFLTYLKVRIEGLSGPIERIKAYVEAVLEFFEKESGFFSIYLYERSNMERSQQGDIQQKILRLYMKPVDILTEILSEAGAKKLIVGRNPRDLATLLNGMVNAAIVLWCMDGKKYRLPDKTDLILNTFLTGVRKPTHVSKGNKSL